MAANDTPDTRQLKKLLKEAIEACGPDLRKVMALPRKAKVVAVKPAGGSYVCSVQAVRADGRPDPAAPVIPDVEIPVIWAGPNRGLVCPPKEGEFCDLGFYDGDPNSPFIMGFRPNGAAPPTDLDGLTVQHSPGIAYGFKPDGTFFVKAPKVEVEAAEKATVKAPTVEVEGAAKVTVKAPSIDLKGAVKVFGPLTSAPGESGEGQGVEMDGPVKVKGDVAVTGGLSAGGNVTAGGSVTDAGGNTNHHSH